MYVHVHMHVDIWMLTWYMRIHTSMCMCMCMHVRGTERRGLPPSPPWILCSMRSARASTDAALRSASSISYRAYVLVDQQVSKQVSQPGSQPSNQSVSMLVDTRLTCAA